MVRRGVVRGVLQLPNSVSNAYLVDGGEGLVLIDTGMPGRAVARFRRLADRLAR